MQSVMAHGASIPALGLGVFRMTEAEVEAVIPAALETGVRHFDTAQIHENEAALGRSLAAAGARRDDVFLTTKVWVSNYSTAPIVTNQIEMHPYLDQSAMSALAQVTGTALIAKIGLRHGKTAAQVGLRWLMQQGVITLSQTAKPARLVENFSVFDFTLTEAEMAPN